MCEFFVNFEKNSQTDQLLLTSTTNVDSDSWYQQTDFETFRRIPNHHDSHAQKK